jgi:Uma2 family endonuclease
MAHGPRHALTVKPVERVLRGVEAFGCHLHVQLPVTLADVQEPEPDVAVVRGRPEDYLTRHPAPVEIVAAVEVADSTLDYDRTTKQRLYATASIARYWLVNLRENQIEVYEQPLRAEGRYALRTDYQPGQVLSLAVTPDQQIEVAVTQVLPPQARSEG